MSSFDEHPLESVKFLNFLLENISSAVFLIARDMKIRMINSSFKTLFQKDELDSLNILCGNSLGCSFAVEEGKPCGTTAECGDCTLRQCVLGSIRNGEDVQSSYLSRLFYINGIPVMKYFRIKTKGVRYDDEDMTVVTIDDITELEEQKIHMRDMANRDYLTGLYNRRYLYDVGVKMFHSARRGNLNLSVAIVDIDHFKEINDTHGHEAGDFVIVAVADVLKTNLRESDVLARIGGEEFCVLLNTSGPDDALKVIEKIRTTVEAKEFLYGKDALHVTFSCGIACYPDASLDGMIRRADEMLYRAKQDGRNRTVCSGS